MNAACCACLCCCLLGCAVTGERGKLQVFKSFDADGRGCKALVGKRIVMKCTY